MWFEACWMFRKQSVLLYFSLTNIFQRCSELVFSTDWLSAVTSDWTQPPRCLPCPPGSRSCICPPLWVNSIKRLKLNQKRRVPEGNFRFNLYWYQPNMAYILMADINWYQLNHWNPIVFHTNNDMFTRCGSTQLQQFDNICLCFSSIKY